VTLQLVWQEYKAAQGDQGYQYSRFCELYGQWRGRLDLSTVDVKVVVASAARLQSSN
jgi:hypothetical protein